MHTVTAAGRPCPVFGDPERAAYLLLQPSGSGESDIIAEEYALLGPDTALAAFPVDWDRDLTPWPAESPFRGQPAFGSGAEETLRFVTEDLLPALGESRPSGRKIFLGGYSLAGLFALWAGYMSGRFDGIAACSPSVWYPGWSDWAAEKPFRCPAAYLSLGDTEERTRHPVLRTVGDAIRLQHARLEASSVRTVLRWNPGNHFRDPARRTADGFRWLAEEADRGHF
ncbi:MAG: esterase [Clostridia bacterium]|nr:esterase [Clostridia bacterium]